MVRLYRTVTTFRDLSSWRILGVCPVTTWRRGYAFTPTKKKSTWCAVLCESCSQKQFILAFGCMDGRAYEPTAMVIRTCSTSIATVWSWSLTRALPSRGAGGIPTTSLFFSSESQFFSASQCAVFLFRILQAFFPRAEPSAGFIKFICNCFELLI